MLDSKIKKALVKLCDDYGGYVFFDYPLHTHTTIGIGGKADAWYVPSGLKALQKTLFFLETSGVRTIIIGNGSNVLIPDTGIEAVIIKLSGSFFKQIIIRDNIINAGAGVELGRLIADCCRYGLAGLEGLAGIPATVGGAVTLNASYLNAISEKLLKVLVFNTSGKFEWRDKKEIKFGYRSSSFNRKEVIIQAEFGLEKASPVVLKKNLKEHFRRKMEKQPLDKKTLGCIFKNPGEKPYTSGELIDISGMKGFRYGDAQISKKHANFILNTGKASSNDVIKLIGKVRQKIREDFSIELEPEIEIL